VEEQLTQERGRLGNKPGGRGESTDGGGVLVGEPSQEGKKKGAVADIGHHIRDPSKTESFSR